MFIGPVNKMWYHCILPTVLYHPNLFCVYHHHIKCYSFVQIIYRCHVYYSWSEVSILHITWRINRYIFSWLRQTSGDCFKTKLYCVEWFCSKKCVSCVAMFLDISTKLTPFYWTSSPPSNKPNSIYPAPLFAELDYWATLFIFQLTQNVGTVPAVRSSWTINNIAK